MSYAGDPPRVVPFPLLPKAQYRGRLSYLGALRKQAADRATKDRVASIATLATDLMRWKDRACTEVDREFAIQQLESALKSLR